MSETNPPIIPSQATEHREFHIPISSIRLADKRARGRETLGDVEGIMLSIQAIGQKYPIIVSDIGNGVYELVDGLHRMTACQRLGMTTILCKLETEMTPLERMKMEVELNNLHNAFSWQDACKHERKFHDLSVAQFGPANRGCLGGGGWGVADTARVFNVSPAKISQDMQLAAAFEEYPHLATLPSRAAALRAYQRIKEGLDVPTEHLAKLQQRVLSSYVLGDFYDPAVLGSIDKGSVDLIITNISDQTRFPELISAIRHVMSPAGSCVFFTNELNPFPLMTRFEQENFVVQKPFGMLLLRDDPQNTMFPFFWCSPNIQLLPHMVRIDSPIAVSRETNCVHSYDIPVAALAKVIKGIPQRLNYILDPFAYGGNTVIAADINKSNCRAYCSIPSIHEEGRKKLTRHFMPASSPALARMTGEAP